MVYTITVHLYAKDDLAIVDKLKAKLIEASRVYSQDKETISWFVMQSTSDPRSFTIVERYENEGVSCLNCLSSNEKRDGTLTTRSLRTAIEPKVSSREPLLADIRPIRHPPT